MSESLSVEGALQERIPEGQALLLADGGVHSQAIKQVHVPQTEADDGACALHSSVLLSVMP